jgi:hypothetical protein
MDGRGFKRRMALAATLAITLAMLAVPAASANLTD